MAFTDVYDVPGPFSLPAKTVPPSVSLQQRVEFAVLLQFAESGRAYWATTAAICEGANRGDVETALVSLVDERSIAGATGRRDSLVTMAEAGLFELTAKGQLRLDEDDV